MSLSVPLVPPPVDRRGGAGWCEECGYSLRGLSAADPCPECGHLGPGDGRGPDRLSPHTAWSRSVFFGLLLLLVLTLNAVSAVLIQPSMDALGGTGPALNMPGPKLWAMPLLQRPIGRSPEQPGVMGTRTALLSLLAVWLVTAPCRTPRLQRDQTPRAALRWASVVLFGSAFGVMLASQGLGPSQLPPFRLLLVAGVELPAATLLYAYLRRLSAHVPGQARREAFGRLSWLVPLTVAGGAGLLGLQWVRTSGAAATTANPIVPESVSLAWSGTYGILASVCGVAATAASLAAAYFHAAFPAARRWVSGGRSLWRRAKQGVARVRAEPTWADRLRQLGIAAGLVLLLAAMVLGNDQVLWLPARQGLGGNVPFVNFPAPRSGPL